MGDAIAEATPAGPCAGYAMHDTWTDTVAIRGVVLIGDAAGYNDPIIGQGLRSRSAMPAVSLRS